jgi:hypothetical protein
LIMGGSGIPIPPQTYLDAADTLYLQPRDFTGSRQALFTPEGFYPTTGVNSLTVDTSEAQGHRFSPTRSRAKLPAEMWTPRTLS